MADTVQCGRCRHFSPLVSIFRADDERENPDSGALGNCDALDPATLPYSWRYCARERMGVWSLEKIECPRFEELRDE